MPTIAVTKSNEQSVAPVSAGGGLFAVLAQEEMTFVEPETRLVPLGFAADVPAGYAVLIVPSLDMAARGLSTKGGVCPAGYPVPLQAAFEYSRRATLTVQAGDVLAFALLVPVADPTLSVV